MCCVAINVMYLPSFCVSDAPLHLVECSLSRLQSIRAFARSCMNYSLGKGWDLFLSTKNTILKVNKYPFAVLLNPHDGIEWNVAVLIVEWSDLLEASSVLFTARTPRTPFVVTRELVLDKAFFHHGYCT